MKIGVTSANIDKLKPAQAAFNKVFKEVMATVIGAKCLSSINEQPVGDEEILLGAKNRLMQFIRTHDMSDYDYLVSFENGIRHVIVAEKDQWFDYVWVIVLDCRTGRKSYAFGQGVHFPTRYVLEAKALGFDKHTVGSIIAKCNPKSSGSDPHYFLTAEQVKRQDILEQALLVALSQLISET